MKRVLLLALIAVACVAGFGPASAEEGEIAGIDWRTDLDAARAEAAEKGRPLLVVFR